MLLILRHQQRPFDSHIQGLIRMACTGLCIILKSLFLFIQQLLGSHMDPGLRFDVKVLSSISAAIYKLENVTRNVT